jgi:methylenetetrahydrofolate dehydrogenase (NADP+)/methenyltetrahydrofolate cyclohydrolase
MATLLSGKEVAAKLNETLAARVCALRNSGVVPCLCILRVGERENDIAYENNAMKRCEKIGIAVKTLRFPTSAAQGELLESMNAINHDNDIHGCLLMRPLPGHMDDNLIRNALHPQKDVDGITDVSMAGVYAGTGCGFPPCTPEACMEILDYYHVDSTGKRAVVVGRSLVAGRPAALMLIRRNATVTVCHTKTADLPSVCRQAEILIVAAGRAGMVDQAYLTPGQTVIDVGINVDASGTLRGDVNMESAQSVSAFITPVPGGVGTVTVSILARHVIEAAQRRLLSAHTSSRFPKHK